jgi:hypothetical protein
MPHAGGLVDKVCTRRLELLVVARHDRRMEDLSASVLGAQRSAQCLVRRCGAVRCGAVQRRAEQSRAVQHAKAQRGTCNVQHATRNMQGTTAAWYLVGSEVQLGTKVLLHKTAHHLPCRTCRYDKTACCTLCALRRCMQAHSCVVSNVTSHSVYVYVVLYDVSFVACTGDSATHPCANGYRTSMCKLSTAVRRLYCTPLS